MTTIAATEAKNRFGELLETVHREPVEISKKGRPVAVVLSYAAYAEMQNELSREREAPDFSGIEAWIESTRQTRKGHPLDEADYYKHLEETHGS